MIAGQDSLIHTNLQKNNNYFNLACDFMEPFRPIVDLMVLTFAKEDFSSEAKSYLQTLPTINIKYKEGKYKIKSVVSAFIN